MVHFLDRLVGLCNKVLSSYRLARSQGSLTNTAPVAMGLDSLAGSLLMQALILHLARSKGSLTLEAWYLRILNWSVLLGSLSKTASSVKRFSFFEGSLFS